MKKLTALFLLLYGACSCCFSQPADSCGLRISLLTCGPGQDLYSLWGHTGIRLTDSARQMDLVFNYGTFDDSDPWFYVKFTRGIMIYAVAPFSFADFMEEYRADKRSVTEQVLNLNCREKTALVKALWKNAAPENRFYPYHFYADNCTTRARNMLAVHMETPAQYSNILPQRGFTTYRQLIHSYMTGSSQAWNRFGIDALLGRELDAPLTNEQAMFLPDYLMKGFDSAMLRHQPLVKEKTILLPAAARPGAVIFTPVMVFSLLLALMLLLSLLPYNYARKTIRLLDRLLFFLTGLLGLLMLLLWLGRVDTVCRNNCNLLWALPTHMVMAVIMPLRKKWMRYYWLFTAGLNALLLLSWKWLPQEMNSSVLLVLILLLFRSIFQYYTINRHDSKKHQPAKQATVL